MQMRSFTRGHIYFPPRPWNSPWLVSHLIGLKTAKGLWTHFCLRTHLRMTLLLRHCKGFSLARSVVVP